MSASNGAQRVAGRLVLEGGIVPGWVEVEGDRIVRVTVDGAAATGPFVAPGFVDVHVHGWGGHDAMGGTAALDGMSRALLRHGVTSFLPTAVTAPLARLEVFADEVRGWMDHAPSDGATPLGFNIEGPCISQEKKGAQNPAYIQDPASVIAGLDPLLDGLRIMTVAPELPAALQLITRLTASGVAVSIGHSNSTADEAAAGYAAGGRTTTHLFNAMSGVDNHRPGLAVTALADDGAYVELVADGLHVERSVWPLIVRAKPRRRLILITDAIALAGVGEGVFELGEMKVEVRNGQCRLVSDGRLAGSVIALDAAVRNLAMSGVPLSQVIQAATANPLDLLGVDDRGRIAPGQVADLVELDDALQVTRVMKAGSWQS